MYFIAKKVCFLVFIPSKLITKKLVQKLSGLPLMLNVFLWKVPEQASYYSLEAI